MTALLITGTGTDVGKTIVTAAIAALARRSGKRVAVLKPAQTGVLEDEPGDIEEVVRLAGEVSAMELARYPDPLAPRTAARRVGRAPVRTAQVAQAITDLHAVHDLVLVEGAGGLLVQFDEDGGTIADAAVQGQRRLQDEANLQSEADPRGEADLQVIVVVSAGLGTAGNSTALTAEALRSRGLAVTGLVVGRWPASPDLACRSNLRDLPTVANAPLLGVFPDNLHLQPQHFRERIGGHLAAALGGEMDVAAFQAQHAD